MAEEAEVSQNTHPNIESRTDMTDGAEFDTAFRALTGHDRFPWQREFYERLIAGRVPWTCDIPTGLGKTAVIPIWLIALAYSDRDLRCPLIPRRLVYIVNRRTIVDQATDVVERIRDRLLKPDHSDWAEHGETLRSLHEGLRQLAATDEMPLAISTLHGELAASGPARIGENDLARAGRGR